MAQQADISSILAALANAGAHSSTPIHPPGHVPQPGLPQGYPGMSASAPPNITPIGLPGYPQPPPAPTNSGTFDLGSMKPSSSGNLNLSKVQPTSSGSIPLNFQEVLNQARGRAAELSANQPHPARQEYNRPPSRSNSPRRNANNDDYNPYRDERRDTRRANNAHQRERSRSRSPQRGRAGFSPSANPYARDRSPPRSDNEIIIVEANVVGLVIGRQGENLRRIEKETQTRIQFITGTDPSGTRRQCRITGPPRSRADAIQEINRIIDDNRTQKETGRPGGGVGGGGDNRQPRPYQPVDHEDPVLAEGESQTQIMVPDKTVGLIIGRGGETIRDLQEKSGCHVNILGENRSLNGLRPVNLIGNAQAAQMAQQLIMEIVESDTRNTAAQAAAGRDNTRGPAPSQYTPMETGKESQTMYVPSEAVGMIIGKGGETIKDIQNTTGCRVNVTQPVGADREREIGLVGTRAAIEEAKRIILEKVDAVSQRDRRGTNSGGGGGRRDDYNSSDRYSQAQQQQPSSYGQHQSTAAPQAGYPGAGPAATGPPPGGEDAYAAYGGYQNYVALWWASAMAQQGQAGQPGAAPPGPPGA